MMNEAQISALIDKKIKQFYHVPGLITKYETIVAIARRVASEVTTPETIEAQTTDATPTVIHTILVEDGECGLIEVLTMCVVSDGSDASTFRRLLHYRKDASSVLTLVSQEDSLVDSIPLVSDPAFNDDGSGNIELEITGDAALTLDWKIYINQKKLIATALP